MTNNDDILITGLGVTSAIGQGKAAFSQALFAGEHRFALMKRPGRQAPQSEKQTATAFLGAEIGDLTMPSNVPRHELRTASLSAQVALATLDEAWHDAALDGVDSSRIGLVVGGSNVQQREQVNAHDKYQNRLGFVRPTYAMSFMDSDICGLCSQQFGIKGFAYTIGGASASGQVAVIEAIEAVRSGRVDVCIALGALMDLSYWECQGFRSLGAMGSDLFAKQPELACRPFDQDHNGFIFGESCGVLVIEKATTAKRSKVYAKVAGWAMGMDGHRNPDPSFEGEVNVIERALKQAGLSPQQIDYVNPHGTGSIIGDEIELNAIAHCGLNHARINATKSIIGHGLTAAGATELVATVLQLQADRLHPTLNLDKPIRDDFNWVRDKSIEHPINNALKMSMGFGGVNTAVCLRKC